MIMKQMPLVDMLIRSYFDQIMAAGLALKESEIKNIDAAQNPDELISKRKELARTARLFASDNFKNEISTSFVEKPTESMKQLVTQLVTFRRSGKVNYISPEAFMEYAHKNSGKVCDAMSQMYAQAAETTHVAEEREAVAKATREGMERAAEWRDGENAARAKRATQGIERD